MYNYNADPSLTPYPTLKPTHTTKPDSNHTRIPLKQQQKKYEHNKYIVLIFLMQVHNS